MQFDQQCSCRLTLDWIDCFCRFQKRIEPLWPLKIMIVNGIYFGTSSMVLHTMLVDYPSIEYIVIQITTHKSWPIKMHYCWHWSTPYIQPDSTTSHQHAIDRVVIQLTNISCSSSHDIQYYWLNTSHSCKYPCGNGLTLVLISNRLTNRSSSIESVTGICNWYTSCPSLIYVDIFLSISNAYLWPLQLNVSRVDH